MIVNGHQDIENRTWYSGVTGKVLVHAAKTYSKKYHDEMSETLWKEDKIKLPPYSEMELGGVIGSVEIKKCVRRHNSRWKNPTKFGFVLDAAEKLPFRKVKGDIGFFNIQ